MELTDSKKFDVIVAGGGPSGAACAISLADSGLHVALLDKAQFPRDKTCGDALGLDVINQLSRLSEKLANEFKELENKIASPGIKLFSPDHSSFSIPLIYNNAPATGYVSPRMDFDNLLFQHARQYSNIHCFENFTVEKIERQGNRIIVSSKKGKIEADIIVGADGAHSVVAKQLANIPVDKKHYYAGLRMYYEGVTGFDPDNLIELHFFKELNPGYLWIFPLANNKANVGIGMLSAAVSRKKINLKETLQTLIQTHPDIKDRFINAKPLETVKGYGLPIGSKKRHISGDRFLLTGDAACLIDPISGEGIANAIRSGRIAASHIKACFASNNFSAAFNKGYDKAVYAAMWKEFRISMLLQKFTRYTWLFNLLVRKSNSVKHIRQLMIEALASVDKRKSMFTRPSFYYKLIFSKKNKI